MIKELIKEIRQQPEHIRSLFMWSFVVIVSSVIGFVWFRNTQREFVALLNPERAQENRALASNNDQNNTPSPFASIGSVFGGFMANISELVNIKKTNNFEITNSYNSQLDSRPITPHKLPTSGDK